jgi:putative aldouronate transport system substrate-binding protein
MVENVLGNTPVQALQDNGDNLDSIRETAFTAIINGNAPLDSFDNFVQDWLANGGQEALDELNQLYPAN